jgi:hypothetical protein
LAYFDLFRIDNFYNCFFYSILAKFIIREHHGYLGLAYSKTYTKKEENKKAKLALGRKFLFT